MILSDCQLKCLAEMHSFSPHRKNTSFQQGLRGTYFLYFTSVYIIIVFYRVVKSVGGGGGVGLLSCLIIKCTVSIII